MVDDDDDDNDDELVDHILDNQMLELAEASNRSAEIVQTDAANVVAPAMDDGSVAKKPKSSPSLDADEPKRDSLLAT